jgi:hypothetical protein
LSSVFVIALGLLAVLSAGAQSDKKHEAELRTVRGSVVDKDDNPVPSSVIYLKNMKTQTVSTHIADDTASYRFSGLDANVDYEIHAEHDDFISATRTVSSFDTHRDIVVILKLKHKKAAH